MNLILIQAFPANETLSKGVIEYFEYIGFKVYFINLPGFHNDSALDTSINSDILSEYIQIQIRNLNLDKYILGGLSYGSYLILNLIKLDQSCKAVLFLEPFLGIDSINISKSKTIILKIFTKIVIQLKLYNAIFKSRIAIKYANKTNGKEIASFGEILTKEVNPKSFFMNLEYILSATLPISHVNVPRLVGMNYQNNRILKTELIDKFFRANQNKDTLFLDVPISHSASEVEYYKKVIPYETAKRMVSFCREYY